MINKKAPKHTTLSRCPIIAVLGHVNHGKTTLLDYIRKTEVASKEHGGITQHISSYQVEISYKEQKSKKITKKNITFIDTPGHEAFVKMRSRGANVADYALLVIAGNDGVMPQTEESIAHIKYAKIPVIVAINKTDLPGINIDKIKKELSKTSLSLEEHGGDVPIVSISAKTGKGIDKLLEMIILISEIYPIKKDIGSKLKAVVIESSLSKSKGVIATVILRSGDINTRDVLISQDQEFRVRALFNWRGEKITKAHASEPVMILGWVKMPPVGTIIYKKDQVEITKQAEKSITQTEITRSIKKQSSKPIQSSKINLIFKTDTIGSKEAILPQIPDNVEVVYCGVGEINESDVLLAKASSSIIIGFNVKVPSQVKKLAQSEKVVINTYKIIYDLLSELTELIDSIIHGKLESITGEGKILALIPVSKGIVAGVKITQGKLCLGDNVKIIRNDKEIDQAKIKSLRFGKKDIKVAKQGTEAGILLSKTIELLTDDSIISIG